MTDDLILFQSADEFRQRPGYIGELTCTSEELDRIVGKYRFSKAEELECGLNGCHTKHWHGYVIRTHDGRETNCGQDCGRREFGVDFEQLEAKARRQEDAQRRRQLLKTIQEDRQQLIAEATALQAASVPWQKKVSELIDSFGREPALLNSFKAVLRDDGRIRAASNTSRSITEAMGRKHSQQDIRTVATLVGGGAFRAYRDVTREIQQQVINPLMDLSSTDLDQLDEKALTNLSKLFDERKRTLRRAGEFIKASQLFFSSENLKRLPLLKETIPKKLHTGRLTRILDGLAEDGS